MGLMDADTWTECTDDIGDRGEAAGDKRRKICPVEVTPRLKAISIGFLLPSKDASIIWR